MQCGPLHDAEQHFLFFTHQMAHIAGRLYIVECTITLYDQPNLAHPADGFGFFGFSVARRAKALVSELQGIAA